MEPLSRQEKLDIARRNLARHGFSLDNPPTPDAAQKHGCLLKHAYLLLKNDAKRQARKNNLNPQKRQYNV